MEGSVFLSWATILNRGTWEAVTGDWEASGVNAASAGSQGCGQSGYVPLKVPI